MAAYGALVSVMQVIDQIQRHPRPPISLHKEHVESLSANLTFLQEFLEGYCPHRSYTSEADPLESRIAEAAYAAEDAIESYIVDQIHARYTDHGGSISSTQFYQDLEKVIQEMDLIKIEVVEMKEKEIKGVQIIKKQPTTEATSSISSSTAHKVTTTVGLDEVLYEMLDRITGGERARQIIPIVGMGGIGKTTLARNIYANPLVKEHFDICAWSTISQVHSARKILTEILGQVGFDKGGDLSDYELGEKLYRHVIGRRYLIVMDDMWDIEAWDKIRSFFPEDENGSRVVVTTRLTNLASKLNYSNLGLDMKFMDEASSWNLFCKAVFGEGICPPELEDIGKKIVGGCRGLPLSIVVVGGLLSRSEATRGNWEVIEKNLSSVVNLEDGGSCLQVLYMSYNNLPVHIKPCFLYMGIFSEDDEFRVFMLIPVMVAEGFIKPIEGRSLEEVAEEYLEELVDRNLVLAEERNPYGKLKSCKMHDLLRDLCLREGEKDKFLFWLKQSSGDRKISPGILSTERRIATSPNVEYPLDEVLGSVDEGAATSSVLARTLMGKFPVQILSLPNFVLLRVCLVDIFYPEEEKSEENYEEICFRLLNLRFLCVDVEEHPLHTWPITFLWNLKTLFLVNINEDYFIDIWKMPLLRHVLTGNAIFLPDPPSDDEVVLENLHTLNKVANLNLCEEVLKRIPNIRILKLEYSEEEEEEEEEEGENKGDYYCLNNLHRLNKLQHLSLSWCLWDSTLMRELVLPYSLKKLTLEGTKLPWEEMASNIGCLPLLQVLKLKEDSFIGLKWETVEGQFRGLKFLKIEECNDLECWITEDNTHFPRLQHLVLRRLERLREIPLSIGDVPTLRSIKVESCSDSAAESAQRIQEEQEEYGNDVLQIQVE